MIPFPRISPPFPISPIPGHRKPHKVPQVYLAVLELKLDLGVINHFAQIPDNHFPPALPEQAGEPLLQVLLLVFLLLDDLCRGDRESRSGLVEGTFPEHLPSRTPGKGAQDGLFVVGSPCQRGEILT